jgi:hypothetical protein
MKLSKKDLSNLEIHSQDALNLGQLNAYVILMTDFCNTCEYRLNGKNFEIANSIYFQEDDE